MRPTPAWRFGGLTLVVGIALLAAHCSGSSEKGEEAATAATAARRQLPPPPSPPSPSTLPLLPQGGAPPQLRATRRIPPTRVTTERRLAFNGDGGVANNDVVRVASSSSSGSKSSGSGNDISVRKVENNHMLSFEGKADASAAGLRTTEPSPEPSEAFPSFDLASMSDVVTAVAGRPAFLPCAVKGLGDRTVSWIRRADLNVLSVGMSRYTQDPRFSVIHQPDSRLWTLQLAYPSREDSGVYECQVGTLPKISRRVTLNVTAHTAKISGGPLLYVNAGSVLNLSCVVSVGRDESGVAAPTKRGARAPPANSLTRVVRAAAAAAAGGAADSEAPDKSAPDAAAGHNHHYVFWYHNGRVLNYDRLARLQRYGAGDVVVSTVTIARAQEAHSGNYTCRPSNAESDTISVHVLNGDQPTLARQGGAGLAPPAGGSALPLAELWRALYGMALPCCLLCGTCVRLR